MTHFWTGLSPHRTYLVPLVVALPTFFLLFSLAEGFSLLMMFEREWDGGSGNVWQGLVKTRRWVWMFGLAGVISGLGWAWVILLPLKRYKTHLDRLAETGRAEKLEIHKESELSFLAVAFNRALEEVEKQLPERSQAILSSISSGVALLDPRGKIEWINPYAGHLFQTDLSKAKEKPYAEVFARSVDLVDMITEGMVTQNDLPRKAVKMTDNHGETRSLAAWSSWVREEDGRPLAMVLTVVDQHRLESVASGVENAGRLSSLQPIASGMAHEIRNPLASARGLAQILGGPKPPSDEKRKSYADVIVQAVDRVNRVLERFDMLLKPPAEDPERTPVKAILESVKEMSSHLAVRKGVSLVFEPTGPDLSLYCRPRQMAQAILNIVINGIEAAPAGEKVRIITVKGAEAWICIEVENTGRSLPAHELDDIFQPFQSTKREGMGLGLAIAESIIRGHGGTVSARSGNNKTSFSIRIPPEPEATQSAEPRVNEAAGHRTQAAV